MSLASNNNPEKQDDNFEYEKKPRVGGSLKALNQSNLYQRSNVIIDHKTPSHGGLWRFVPGDIIEQWQPGYFDTRNNSASTRQLEERNFYVPCSSGKRKISQIKAEGPIKGCNASCFPEFVRRNPKLLKSALKDLESRRF